MIEPGGNHRTETVTDTLPCPLSAQSCLLQVVFVPAGPDLLCTGRLNLLLTSFHSWQPWTSLHVL